jgi:hypothetical protein
MLCPFPPPCIIRPESTTRAIGSNVGTSDLGRRGRAVGKNLAALLNVQNGCVFGGDRVSVLDGVGIGESHRAEVGEGNQAAGGAGALLKVFDNPLSIVLAKRTIRHIGEGLGHGRARGQVLDSGASGRLARGNDGHQDGIASSDGDAGEIVWGRCERLCKHQESYAEAAKPQGALTGVVGVPLIPCIIGDGRAFHIPVDTGLENGSLASITVDTDPLHEQKLALL